MNQFTSKNDPLVQAATSVLSEAKPADPANLRSIIGNHTKLLSSADNPKAQEFHKTAIANAKEKLKSLGEDLDEANIKVPQKFVDYARKVGSTSLFAELTYRNWKPRGLTDQQMLDLITKHAKKLKAEAELAEGVQYGKGVQYPTDITVKKAFNIVTQELDADQMEEFLFSLSSFYLKMGEGRIHFADFKKTSDALKLAAINWSNRR